MNNWVNSHLVDKGIYHRISYPYTPQKNGRAKCRHRHIAETGLSILFHAHALASLWFDAFATTIYVINRIPSSLLNEKSPYEVLFHLAPNYGTFKPFGCRIFPYLLDYAKHKLAPNSRPCIFLGYNSANKGFRCFDHISFKVFISRHAHFHERNFPFSSNNTSLSPELSTFSFLDDIPPLPHAVLPPLHHIVPVSQATLCRTTHQSPLSCPAT